MPDFTRIDSIDVNTLPTNTKAIVKAAHPELGIHTPVASTEVIAAIIAAIYNLETK